MVAPVTLAGLGGGDSSQILAALSSNAPATLKAAAMRAAGPQTPSMGQQQAPQPTPTIAPRPVNASGGPNDAFRIGSDSAKQSVADETDDDDQPPAPAGLGSFAGFSPVLLAATKKQMQAMGGAGGGDNAQDKALAIAQAGFGMMGSGSPYAGEAVGKGGMAGIEALLAMRKQRALMGLQQAEASRNQIAAIAPFVPYMTKDQINSTMGGLGMGSQGAPGGQPPGGQTAPGGGATAAPMGGGSMPPSGGGTGAPAGGGVSSSVIPPTAINQAMADLNQYPAGSPRFNAAMDVLKTAAQYDPSLQARLEGAKTGASEGVRSHYTMVDAFDPATNTTKKVPLSSIVGGGGGGGFGAATGTQSGGGGGSTTTQPSGGVGVQTEPTPVQKTQAAIAAKYAETVPNANVGMAQQEQRLGILEDTLGKLQTGAWAEDKGDVIAGLRSIGLDVPNMDTANPAAVQIMVKNSLKDVFDQIKAIGGRPLVTEITGLSKATQNPDLQPEANKEIIAQAHGLIDWQKQYNNDFSNQYAAGPMDLAKFSQQWTADHPLSGYVQNRLKSFGVKGVDFPDVPIGGVGVADKDQFDRKGNVVLRAGDKYMKDSAKHFIPLNSYLTGSQ
jgi:hypothetical protein